MARSQRSGLRFTALALLAFLACKETRPTEPSPPAPQGSETAPTGPAFDPNAPATPEQAAAFVRDLDAGLRKVYVAQAQADWDNQTNITDATDKAAGDAKDASLAYVTEKIKQSVRFKDVQGIDPVTARQLELLRTRNDLAAPNDPKERRELADILVSLNSTYGKGKYCSAKLARFATPKVEPKAVPAGEPPASPPKDPKGPKATPAPKEVPCLTLGELSKILENQFDTADTSTSGRTKIKKATYEEMVEAWKGWRTISPPMRKPYERFVELGNKGAKDIGFKDVGELWRSRYDMSATEMEAEVERLWQQVKPLYADLHCYARTRLKKRWGDKIADKGPLPAHVFGNMWSQTWGNIYDDLEPYKGEVPLDVTKGLAAKGMKPVEMVRAGESFFDSLGLGKLPPTFWDRSMITKPEGREVVCHASAWDLTFNGDVRIKMCTEPTEEDLITIHHELGHDYYFLAYHKKPMLFQDGANDGFHEGIGDTLALSVTPEYLVNIGLLDKAPANEKAEMNVLMRRGLDKIAFLPFGLLIDKWRWDVFSGKTAPADYNKAWWALVEQYQGIKAPVARSEADFDPGAKYHVPGNTPYLRYFLADIYQFQFHRALCKAAGHKGPLHKCSIFNSKAAGKQLQAMMAMGSEAPWPEALKAISGETKADATAIIDYFDPLSKWLKEQNKGKACGW
jgi:peptidyl-dipeptidase A